MPASSEHRKTVRHIDDPGHAHELTFSCYQRLPLLTNDRWRILLSQGIDQAVERHRYRLVAFVYMPEHVHLLVYPTREASPVADLLTSIKRPVSHRIKQALAASRSPMLQRLTIQQRPGVSTFRFWQEGPGYDRNITESVVALAVVDYIHLNPVRRKLCQQAADWRWSTARYYQEFDGPRDTDLPRVEKLPAEFLK